MGKWCLGKPGSLRTWFPKEALWAQQVLPATRGQEMHSAAGCGRSPKSRPRGSPQGFQHRNPQASPEETPPLSETYRGSLLPRDEVSNSSVLSYPTPAHPEQNHGTCHLNLAHVLFPHTRHDCHRLLGTNQGRAPCEPGDQSFQFAQDCPHCSSKNRSQE